MSSSPFSYLLDVVVSVGGALGVFFWWVANRRRIAAETVGKAEQQASQLLRDADREIDTRKKEAALEAKEHAHQLLVDADKLARERRLEAQRAEQGLADKAQALTERLHGIERLETDLKRRESGLGDREATTKAAAAKYEQLVAEQQRELQRVASLTADEARELLLKQLEADARRDAANLVKRLEAEARETAAAKARLIVTQAIQRSAAEHAIETTVSVVDLPSDDMKGRIIGREGRNIRALEQATGVELIIDDTPGAIILSSFDPFRREVARQSIERLIADGRIHPARIEEVVEKVKAEMEETVKKDGEAAAFELGLFDLHPEIARTMGRLKFRTSYGQNVLNHSREVAFLAGIMAREVGLDAGVTTRAAFLHDIGKAIDRDLGGSHLELGVEFLKKHGESRAVIDAVAAHHMDIDWPSLEAMLVQAADAISAARPGARRDILESYVKRLEKLEDLADSFKGVSKAFALQAGREIRILVEAEQVTDEEAVWMSKDIARRIENELEYPGQIKVTVIRETRAVEYRQVTAATVGDAGEHALIARLRACFADAGPRSGLVLGIGDDAAVIAPERNTLDVLTTDALVEGVHFDRRWMSARDIGHKAAAVNLSDLGAMGARPRHLLVSLGLPPDLALADFDDLIDGIASSAAAHRAVVAGGNITSSPGRLFIDITALGSVRPRKILTRSGARAGDEVYVTGQLGGAAAGLALCLAGQADATDPHRASALQRFRHPTPPVAFGVLIGRNRAASAGMDLSDGLVDGLTQMAAASGVGVEIRVDTLPKHPTAEDELFRDCQLALVLSGGEDYELLFAVPRRRRRSFLTLARQAGVVVTHIGEMHRTPGVRLQRPDGTLIEPPRGFTHFAR